MTTDNIIQPDSKFWNQQSDSEAPQRRPECPSLETIENFGQVKALDLAWYFILLNPEWGEVNIFVLNNWWQTMIDKYPGFRADDSEIDTAWVYGYIQDLLGTEWLMVGEVAVPPDIIRLSQRLFVPDSFPKSSIQSQLSDLGSPLAKSAQGVNILYNILVSCYG